MQRGLAVTDEFAIVLERQQQRPHQRSEHDSRADEQPGPAERGQPAAGKVSGHQMVVIASAGRTRCSSLRNGNGSPPKALARKPRKPASGASMKRQINVTIVTDSTAEEKKMPRKIAALRLARLSASASASAI